MKTALYDVHAALGARFTDFAGWTMPLRYGSETAEHVAVRTAAGLFDLSHMGQLAVNGPSAGEALDAALVSKIAALPVGRAKYTLLCGPDGGILDDLIVYRLDESEFLVVANASNTPRVTDELTARFSGFDVALDPHSPEKALVALQGPRAAEILARHTETALDGVKYYTGTPGTVCGRPALIARTGYTGEDGFELFVAGADAPALWQALLESGTPLGCVPAGLACRDTLRLEAGMPLYGNELALDVSPYEAGLGRVVALDKPAFVGREALAAAAEQQPTRVLVGLRGSTRIPRHGCAVVDGTGRQVGLVTSGAPSPTLGVPVAMAYVAAAVAAPGTALAVDVRGTAAPVSVVALPFYRRPGR